MAQLDVLVNIFARGQLTVQLGLHIDSFNLLIRVTNDTLPLRLCIAILLLILSSVKTDLMIDGILHGVILLPCLLRLREEI